MTLADWDKQNRWLKKEPSSPEEIAGLIVKVEKNLKTAANIEIDEDWRLSIAFAAAFQCATIALRAEGYRLPVEPGHHEKTINSLKHTVDPRSELISKLQSFRKKRSIIMYDSVGTASGDEVAQVLGYAEELYAELKKWLTKKHPELLK